MRKESRMRLLLSLFTAFIMVAGVFVAAVQTMSFNQSGDQPAQSTLEIAASGLDTETRETGDAPVSAFGDDIRAQFASTSIEGSKLPSTIQLDTGDSNREASPSKQSTTNSIYPSNHGTRAPTVDALGPYGDANNPYYEGDTVTFDADIVGGSVDDYMFRWNVIGDEQFEGPGAPPDYWGAYGESEYSHEFLDNSIGEAVVEAWDGVSWKSVTGGGTIWNGYDAYGWLMGGYLYVTVGLQFDAKEDITIDSLGVYRYGSYAYTYYNLRLWKVDGQQLLYSVDYPYIPYYVWTWFDITPQFCQEGEYIVSVGIYYYYQIGDENPGPTADGVIEPLGWCYADGEYSYPGNFGGYDPCPFLDVNYEYSYQVPDVLQDSAGIYVDNVAPIVGGASAIGEPGLEGISEVGFTASFIDPGLDDDFWWRVDFGDGKVSDWKQVIKFSGGLKALWLHSYTYYEDYIVDNLKAALGPAALIVDQYDCGQAGNYDCPDLEVLKDYDVILIGSNYIPASEVGDTLADYCEQGGGVVELVAMFHPDYGISGDWRSEGYSVFEQGTAAISATSPTIFDPSHPIIDGYCGVASSWGCSLAIGTPGITAGAVYLAEYSIGYPAAAYRVEDERCPGSGRVAGLNIFAQDGYISGDAWTVIGNAAFWAAQATPPEPLTMPLTVEGITHIYADDHPTHITPQDVFNAKVEVKDDDHLKLKPDRTHIFSDDFSTNTGWTTQTYWEIDVTGPGSSGYNGADPVQDHSPTADNRILGTEVPGIFYDSGQKYATSPVIDTTGYDVLALEYYKHDHTDYISFQYWNLEVKDTNGNWQKIWEGYDSPGCADTQWMLMEFADEEFMEYAAQNPNFQIRFSYTDNAGVFTVAGSNIDDIDLFTSDYFKGLGFDTTTVLIANVEPTVVVPDIFVDTKGEMAEVTFEDFRFTDPALRQKTESFWWRWDMDDGTPIADWEVTNQLIPGAKGGNLFITGCPMDFWVAYGYTIDGATRLLYNVLMFSQGDTGSILYLDVSWYGSSAIMSMMESTLESNFPVDYDWTYTTGTHDLLDANGNPAFDVLYFGYDWAYYGAPPYDVVQIGDYIQAGGDVIVTGDEFNYGVLDFLPWYVEYDPTFGNDFFGPAFMDWPADVISDGVQTGNWVYLYPLHNLIEDYDPDEYIPIFADPDPIHTIMRVGEARYPKNQVWTVQHLYGDNGIYYVDLQLIDDDMGWDFSSGYPVDTGGATISHNIIPVTINKVDPVISPKIRAYAELDLSLRMSGNKHNTATMRLIENGANIGEVTVYRDPGAPDVGVLSGIIEMTQDYDYKIEIEYDPNDLAGANPTWIFEAHWPDGKIKQLKHTFNSNDPSDRVWTIDNVRQMMLGHDIIFEAWVADDGSDDLACIWNFGDSTPFGVHLYANADPDVLVGDTDEATVIFNQDPDRDPWFDTGPNNIRSPWGKPTNIMDSISHVFDINQPYYYYVTLTVLDDDVKDGYPSPYLNGGGYDMEFVEISFV